MTLIDKFFTTLGIICMVLLAAALMSKACRAEGVDDWKRAAYFAELQHDIPYGLLHAIIEQESMWRPNVISNKGAIGLAQILPSTVEMIAPGRYKKRNAYTWGSVHDDVERIQKRLARDGLYTRRIDRIYGGGTYTGVRTFQRANNLHVDGIVGPLTWAALFPGEYLQRSTVIEALHDPYQNIGLAAEYLAWMRDHPKCPKSWAGLVAAYYSGCGSKIVRYVASVERRYGGSL